MLALNLVFYPQSSTIINTAILTSQPMTLPVIVLAVGNDGKVSDVTSAVRCQSTNEDIVKVTGQLIHHKQLSKFKCLKTNNIHIKPKKKCDMRS